MDKNKLDGKRLNALNEQIISKFDSATHKLSLTNMGTRKLRVRVSGGTQSGFQVVRAITAWSKRFNLDTSYLGRVRGRAGGHVLEVRS